MKTFLAVGAAALALTSLSACAGVTGLAPTGGNSQQFFDNLQKFNDAAGQACGGYGNLDWNPPLPPTGSLHVQCRIGQAPMIIAQPAPAVAH